MLLPVPICEPSRYQLIPLPLDVKVVSAPLHSKVLAAVTAGADGVALIVTVTVLDAVDVPQLFDAVAV